MTEKLMHVSFTVKDTNLHGVLISIEPHKVGNLEVRAVQPRLALPAPGAETSVGRVLRTLGDRKLRVVEIARELGVPTKVVASALNNLRNAKLVKRVSHGVYRRAA